MTFPRLLRLPAVRDRVGLSRAQIYRMINTGDFPAPVRPSPGTVAWNEVEVDAWIEARIATSKKAGDA
jgi:prophage regulatory protein